MGFLGWLTLSLIILKLINAITLSWWIIAIVPAVWVFLTVFFAVLIALSNPRKTRR